MMKVLLLSMMIQINLVIVLLKKVSGVGNVRIEVYLNGALVQETAL